MCDGSQCDRNHWYGITDLITRASMITHQQGKVFLAMFTSTLTRPGRTLCSVLLNSYMLLSHNLPLPGPHQPWYSSHFRSELYSVMWCWSKVMMTSAATKWNIIITWSNYTLLLPGKPSTSSTVSQTKSQTKSTVCNVSRQGPVKYDYKSNFLNYFLKYVSIKWLRRRSGNITDKISA